MLKNVAFAFSHRISLGRRVSFPKNRKFLLSIGHAYLTSGMFLIRSHMVCRDVRVDLIIEIYLATQEQTKAQDICLGGRTCEINHNRNTDREEELPTALDLCTQNHSKKSHLFYWVTIALSICLKAHLSMNGAPFYLSTSKLLFKLPMSMIV